jgi:hypothetical protein
LSDLDIYIMTLNDIYLKGISLLSYLCGLWLTFVKKLLKQDAIIIGATIESIKSSMIFSGIGLNFTRNGLGVGISMFFEIFGQFL